MITTDGHIWLIGASGAGAPATDARFVSFDSITYRQ
jgi:hypothetical protein